MTGPVMRVAHVICGEGFAGVERHVVTLAKAQAQSGLAVTVIGGAPEAMRAALADSGVSWRAAPSTVGAARSLARVEATDLIHTHMSSADLVGSIVAPRHRAPVVSTRHFAAPRGSTLVARALMGLVRSRIAAQIAISAHVARSIEGESVVIHPGVEALDGAGPRERTVLLVQRLEPEKATEVAISAWAALGEQRDGWRLVIVGDGSQRSALEAQAAADGVGDSVDFVGFTPDVSPLLTRAAVFVATTPNEGLGLAVVEAMSAGTPVIAPGSGGYLETVGMVEGSELYRPSDAADLAARLRLLLEDESRRTRYGRALRDRQREHFSPESQARATRLIYDSVLQ